MTPSHTPDSCRSIFISWVWAVGILVGVVSGASLLAWSGSEKLTETKYELRIVSDNVRLHDTRILRLEKVAADLDSIKDWVRK